jgi:hypothetical protein
MKSATIGGISQGGLGCFMLMYFLLPPLDTGHMAKLGADQHKGRITIFNISFYVKESRVNSLVYQGIYPASFHNIFLYIRDASLLTTP